MKHYSVKVFALTIILFVLSIFAIEYSIQHHFSQDSYYTQAVIAARNSEVKCAVFGDSHGAASFRDELQNCFNFAAGGMGLAQIEDSVKSVRLHNSLSQVLITFGPQMFSAERVNNTSAVFASIGQEFAPLYNPLVLQPLMFDRWKVWFKEQLFNAPDKTLTANTRHWGTVTESKQQQAIALRLLKQTPLPGFQTSSTQQKLQALIQDLKQNGSEVCLVRTPVTADYAKVLQPVLDSTAWQGLLAELQTAGAIVIDYQQLDAEFHDHEFINEDHLNPAGAKIFSTLAYKACFG